ncbi:SDR family NAD(P)-dependent oxidoreductase [Salirhabdus salicampi]|uniref:SDR family NAD(P)-dependent oxidoreductase n=1 Tax=Salirhabdus salicampi TaxID=476102 RepID=UPI0020C2DD7B|nr:SDR family oxidoreductase [Salirhabdus salicampi]MCP8617359.1 SDR family oxidoreductase [Salirhabdus salicampi]
MKKVVMITGASKGLGRALAIAFAQAGYKLAICARGKETLTKVQSEIEQLGGEVIAVAADVSIEADVERFVSITELEYGQIDVLINNASIFGPGPSLLLDYPVNKFQNVLHVNIMNPFFVTRRVLPGMLTKGSGSIINVTSEAGKTGFSEWGAYGVSKFGLEGMTEIWADELEGTGVVMNMVDPGEMDTDMHKVAVPDCDYELQRPEDVMGVFFYLAETKADNGKRFEAGIYNESRKTT